MVVAGGAVRQRNVPQNKKKKRAEKQHAAARFLCRGITA